MQKNIISRKMELLNQYLKGVMINYILKSEYKKILIIHFSLFILLVFSSCQKTVYFDVETQENKLVVNSFIGPESGAIADVSLSLAPLDYDEYPEYITNATLQLFKNEILIANYTYNETLYKYTIDNSLTAANEGDVFKVIASVPGKETVSAITTIPEKVEIENIHIADTIELINHEVIYDSLGYPIFTEDTIPYYKIEIEFTDPAGENYYNLITTYEDASASGNVCFTTNDPVYTLGDEFSFGDSENDFYTVCDNAYFSDITFNGTKKILTVYLIQVDGVFFDDPKYIFTLQHVSSEYYKYFSTVNLQNGGTDNPFAQIVTVFSNIEGGFGIFSSYNEITAEIEL
ncbi:MAG: DUF4249 domain-containing protein [Fimbriimonadaceae bacterium]|nr:DUF4249 domain-containing protein [Chitinophagales bacterium]